MSRPPSKSQKLLSSKKTTPIQSRVSRFNNLARILEERNVIQQSTAAAYRVYIRSSSALEANLFISRMERLVNSDVNFEINFDTLTNSRIEYIIEHSNILGWVNDINLREEVIRLGTSYLPNDREEATRLLEHYRNVYTPLVNDYEEIEEDESNENAALAQQIVELVSSQTEQHIDVNVNIQQFQDIITEIRNLYSTNPNIIILMTITEPNSNEHNTITLTGINIGEIIEQIERVETTVEEHGSDAVERIRGMFTSFTNINVSFSRFIPHTRAYYQNQQGALFRYINTSDKDLSRYGIYKSFDPKLYRESCLFKALKEWGLTDNQIQIVKQTIIPTSHMIPMKYLEDISEALKMGISLRIQYDKGRKFVGFNSQYCNRGLIKLTLLNMTGCDGLRMNHYIVDNKVEIIKTIKQLMQEGKFIPMTSEQVSMISAQYFVPTPSMEINITDYPIETEEIKAKEFSEYIPPFTFCDFESREVMKNENHIHEAYLGVLQIENGDSFEYSGENCAYNMLSKAKEIAIYKAKKHGKGVKPQVVMLFHNMKFDWQFIFKYVTVTNQVQMDSRLISVECMFKNVKITLRDSYSMIPSALKEFSKLFKIDTHKEIIPYDWYNLKTIDEMKNANYENVLKYIKEDNHEQFKSNLRNWECINVHKKTVDMLRYSMKYCIIDCNILRQGWNITRETFIRQFEDLDINKDIFTISSLAHEYMIKSGGLKDCFMLKGFVQRFIQGCVRGGTTRTANNYLYHLNEPVDGKYCTTTKDKNGNIIKKEYHDEIRSIEDYDAVSLYPSAMIRMKGALKGKPKYLTSDDINAINNQKNGKSKIKYIRKNFSAVFADVLIKSVGKKLNMPVLCEPDSNGVLQYTNNIVGKKYRIDCITLENLVLHHNIDFRVQQGYKFDEGFNKQFGKCIQHMFKIRKEYKLQGNPAEQCIKLALNSSYGKLILKFRKTETKIITGRDRFEIYLQRNIYIIRSFRQLSYYDAERCTKDVYEIKIRNNNGHSHSNMCHIGSQVLAMSKLIMHEALSTAEEGNIPVFYQDTDSMHFYKMDLPKLENSYFKKFNRLLSGNDIGQFNSEFKNVEGHEAIYLGKKLYSIRLSNNEYHTRCKGVSNESIKHTCKLLGNESNDITIYKSLFDGGTVEFDLTCQGTKFVVRYTSDGIQALKEGQFVRTIRLSN